MNEAENCTFLISSFLGYFEVSDCKILLRGKKEETLKRSEVKYFHLSLLFTARPLKLMWNCNCQLHSQTLGGKRHWEVKLGGKNIDNVNESGRSSDKGEKV